MTGRSIFNPLRAPLTASGGLLVWLALPRILPARGIIGEIEHVLLFAVLVVVPLALELLSQPDRHQQLPRVLFWDSAVPVRWQPFAAALVVLSLVLDHGLLPVCSALLCVPWLLLTLMAAAHALRRLLARGFYPIAECVQDLGWIYWPVGAIWLIAHRLEWELMGFPGKIVILTAVHFHFAGLAAPLVVGTMARLLEYPRPASRALQKLVRISALLVAAGIPLTAAGIAASPLIEWMAATAIAIGLWTAALLWLWRLVPALLRGDALPAGDVLLYATWRVRLAGFALVVACASVLSSMFFAVRFAFGEYFPRWSVPIDAMVIQHGWWNALGFAGCGLLACLLLRPASRRLPAGIPFSRLKSDWHRLRVGPDFFERSGLIDPDQRARGLCDDLREYTDRHFDAGRVHPDVRAFYEDTDRFTLSFDFEWRPLFRQPARVYRWLISSRLEQMNFPVEHASEVESTHAHEGPGELAAQAMVSQIVPLRDAIDGRTRVRGWVRYYKESGAGIYSAAYAAHHHAGRAFMNIAFPVPFGSMTSVLRFANLANGAIELTSLPRNDSDGPGDEGVYCVFAASARAEALPCGLRLPINETIRVYPAQDSELALTAEHQMWLCGVPFLKLRYFIST